ncbi:MAG TPA: ABC transporter permease [Vicinamibacteria bacterium]
MEELWRDVRFAVRTLRQSPGFTLIAVATLALGIGANTAIFSVINAILLRPLPYPEAERLVFLTEWSEQVPEMSFSVANLKDVRDQNQVFGSLVAYNGQNFILSAGAGAGGASSQPERVNGRQVTSGIFETLGKQPIVGRAFGPEEEKAGAPGVALLGEGFWERRFGRDSGVVGQTLVLSGDPFTVIGVMPRSMHSSWRNTEIFTPLLRLEDRIGGENNRGNHPGIYVIGRLKPGVDVAKARSDVKAIATRLAEKYPNSNAKQSMTAEPLHEAVVGDMRPALMLLLGAVGFVLLIACANVANLLLARAAERQREIAVRLALGARRARVLRQLLTESVLLSLLGAVAGVLLGYLGLQALLASLPAGVPRVDEVKIDVVVLAVTAALAIVTGLAFGIVPAWRALSTKLHEPLKESGRGNSGGPGQHRVRNGLVIAEVSMALVLLVGAGLMLRSFYRVLHADAGFRSEGLVIANVALPQTGYSEPAKRAALFERVLAELKSQPGVKGAAATLPLLGGWQSSFSVEGKPEPPPGQRPSADIARVSPDYFSVMGIRVLQGRVFEDRDRDGAPTVCIVDQRFAETHWPGESPLGKRLKFGSLDSKDNPWMEVVGQVAHVKNYGVDEESRVELYLPFLQNTGSGFSLVAKTDNAAGVAAASLRAAMRAASPDIPLYQVRALDELVAERSAQRRLAAQLISVFAIVALVLAAVGIYGVMSYAVAQRTQEIGIRMALGAGEESILQMVLRNGATLALLGVAIGLVAAFVLARLISALLFQTSAADPPTFSLVPLLLLIVALLACYLPARRAARVDPMVALRNE